MTIRERNKQWQAQVRLKGHEPLSATFATRKLAQDWKDETIKKLREGVQLKAVPSVAVFCERYAKTFKVNKYDELCINKMLRTYRALHKPVLEMTEDDALFIRDDLLSKCKSKTVQKYLGMLRRALRKARTKWGFKGLPDPFEDIGLKVVDKPRDRRITQKEYELIKEYLLRTRKGNKPNELPKQAYLDIIDWALETAMRRGEIAKIRKAHVAEDYSSLYIPETKTDTPRTIPLSPKAQNIIRRRMNEVSGQFLFPVTPRNITKRFVHICNMLGIEDLHFHDLRHTALSRYDQLGFSKGQLKLIGGHKTDKMLMRYLHADLSETLERMKKTC